MRIEPTEIVISDSILLSRGSQFGHVGININGIMYSRAHSIYFRGDAETYIQRQMSLRDSVGMVLNTSPEEEAKLLAFLEKRVKENKPYSILSNSCSSNAADALEGIDIHVIGPWQLGIISPADILTNLPKTGRVHQTNWYGKIKN